ncbi:MAG: MFS transporter [Opitutaceae bacterium]|jgi:glycoside/pentoside/hexuronide:cation symporter, GPH family|nr:MFS transporter [Opitutaceae bacterium]
MSAPTPATHTLSAREKIGYGLGDTASNFIFHTVNVFLFFYYADVMKLNPAAVGTLFLVARLFDTVTDPLMGSIADRTNSRWGKYRPYLLWLAIPFGICGYLLFAVPDTDPAAQLTYAYITYIAVMLVYTAINIPYSALLGVISPNSSERTSVASYRFACAFGGQLLIVAAARPLIAYFGEGDQAAGYRVTMGIFAVIAVVLFIMTFSMTRERVQPPAGQKSDLAKEFKLLLRNVPWIVMFIAGIFTLANVAVRGAVTLFYFKYYAGDDGSPWLFNFDLSTVFLTAGTIALIIGVMCTKWITPLGDKRQLMVALSILNAIVMALFYFVPQDAHGMMFFMNVLGALIAGPTIPLVWSMFADVADYGEWKFGHRSTGLVFSGIQFAQKFGLAIGGAAAGWMLSGFGYVADAEQSPEAIQGIRLMFTVLPALFAVGGVIAIWFYPITGKDVERMGQELAAKKT